MHRIARARPSLILALALAIGLLGAACSNKRADLAAGELLPAAAPSRGGADIPQADLQGGSNRNGSQLAYEHEVTVRLEAERIALNLAKVREACTMQSFGQCDLLGEELGAGEYPNGSLSLRAAPAAVSGLVGLAAEGGNVAQRSTRAEDLADAVRDNGLRRKRLELQHAKLTEILGRRDTKVADLITLTERLAVLEAELNAAEQEGAQQQRRIQTNLLTIQFQSVGISAASSRIGESLRGLTATWDASIAALITIVIGGLLPFALLAGFVWWLVAKIRKRSRLKAAPTGGAATGS